MGCEREGRRLFRSAFTFPPTSAALWSSVELYTLMRCSARAASLAASSTDGSGAGGCEPGAPPCRSSGSDARRRNEPIAGSVGDEPEKEEEEKSMLEWTDEEAGAAAAAAAEVEAEGSSSGCDDS